MNKLKFIFLLIIFMGLGYLLGNFFPFRSAQTSVEDIQGESVLQVKVVTEEGSPLPNIEVDIAENIGQPPVGGVVLSDSQGIAVFNLKPGNYYIFFNTNNFPVDLNYPEAQSIEVKKGVLNAQTIVLSAK